MRSKGYTLNEMVLVIALLGVLLLLSSQPLRILLQEIPTLNRVMEDQTKLDGFMEVLRQDVQQASDIYMISADRRIGGNTLALNGSAEQILYKINSGSAVRIIYDPATGAADSAEWQFPHIWIEWDVYESDGKPTGVTITSWYQKRYMGTEQKKFRRSNVFFTGLERTRLNP